MKYYTCDVCEDRSCSYSADRVHSTWELTCPQYLGDVAEWLPACSWRIQIWITWILCVITLIALWVGVGGCTKTAMKRMVIRGNLIQRCHLADPIITDPITIEYIAFTHWEFMMRSKMEEAEVVVDGDYRHYSVGSREQYPDPNTVEALRKKLGLVDVIVGVGGL